MSVFGLDIGSTSSKIVQLERDGNKFRLLAAGLVPTPTPGLASEADNALVALATALKKLHQDARVTTKNVITALPEGQIFSRVIELPPMNDDELAQAIPWEAEQFVPKPLNEVNLDWQVVSRGGLDKEAQPMKVLLVAAPKVLISKYLKVCSLAGFEVVAIETEMTAVARALVPPNASPTMLVDFGAKTTDLTIVDNGQVVMTRSIPTAGEAFTRAVSTGLALEITQAEEYKRAYGLAEKELEGKVKGALTPVFEAVSSEIKKALAFWQEKETKPVASVVLTGGTANLPEVSTLLARSLGIEVQLANPFSSLTAEEKAISSLKNNASVFAVAVGLAQKEI